MNIWLIMSGEPLEQFGERPHRVGILSKMLLDKGHIVTWWTTSYDHQYKRYLYDVDTEVVNENGVNMVFLHSATPYKKNISLDRIKNHQEVSLKFKEISSKQDKPDIIFCAFPTIDLAYEAVKYANLNNIPIVIDIRDLWPDIFFDPFPKILHPILKFILRNYIQKTKYIFKNCTAITAVSEKYLQYGLNYGNRQLSEKEKVFPLAYNKEKLDSVAYNNCEMKFCKLGVDKNKTIIWFVGTFGRTYDLNSVIEVANELKDNQNIQFIFSGDGEKAIEWKKLANKTNIIFTGWVDKNDLLYLASIANIGLMAYKKGAPQGLPNKVFEYMAYGLPILSSLKGETQKLLETNKIGFTYENKEELKENLMKLIEDDTLYETMSHNAKLLFENQFSAQKVYVEMIDCLETTVREEKNV